MTRHKVCGSAQVPVRQYQGVDPSGSIPGNHNPVLSPELGRVKDRKSYTVTKYAVGEKDGKAGLTTTNERSTIKSNFSPFGRAKKEKSKHYLTLINLYNKLASQTHRRRANDARKALFYLI